jgi:hypothetical protein
MAALLSCATSSPLFVVLARRPSGQATSLTSTPDFGLLPNWSLGLWIAFGVFNVSFSLSRGWGWASVGVVFNFVWALIMLLRLRRLAEKAKQMTGRGDFFSVSPYAGIRRHTGAWLPTALVSLVGAAVALATNLKGNAANDVRLYGACEFVFCAVAVCLMLGLVAGLNHVPRRRPIHMLSLPSLNAWYAGLPSSAQPIVAKTALAQRAARYPSSTWRTIPDLSREFQAAGIAHALFGEDGDRLVWKRNATHAWTYFAPISVPLLALVLAPLLFNVVQCFPGIDDRSKLLFGVATFVWATWSISFFVSMGTRDFAPRLHSRFGQRFLAERFAHRSFDERRRAAAFFADRGSTFFQLVAVAIVPAYLTYISLFGSAKEKCVSPAAVEQPTESVPSLPSIEPALMPIGIAAPVLQPPQAPASAVTAAPSSPGIATTLPPLAGSAPFAAAAASHALPTIAPASSAR